MKVEIIRLPEFTEWLNELTAKPRVIIQARLSRIEIAAHFGNTNHLGEGLFELKFENGTRIYFAHSARAQITIALGGNKNGQNKDIKRARKILFG